MREANDSVTHNRFQSINYTNTQDSCKEQREDVVHAQKLTILIQTRAPSRSRWLMIHYGWLAGLSWLAVVSTAAA